MQEPRPLSASHSRNIWSNLKTVILCFRARATSDCRACLSQALYTLNDNLVRMMYDACRRVLRTGKCQHISNSFSYKLGYTLQFLLEPETYSKKVLLSTFWWVGTIWSSSDITEKNNYDSGGSYIADFVFLTVRE